jgi:hypothetical protein
LAGRSAEFGRQSSAKEISLIETSLEGVVERLGQLETENRRLARKVRWLTGLGVTSILVVVISVACGAAMLANPEINPGRIGIGDPAGSRIGIGLVADENGTFIDMYDVNGKVRMRLANRKDEHGLAFFDGNGKQIP